MFLAGELSDGLVGLVGLRLVAKGCIDDAKLHRETPSTARRPPSSAWVACIYFLAGVFREPNVMDEKGLGILTTTAGASIL